MGLYALYCDNCGAFDAMISIKEYQGSGHPCPKCGEPTIKDWERSKVFFVEDRIRFHDAGPDAPDRKWSWALGGPMPESRQERRLIEKQKGIEFLSPSEAPDTWKTAMAYRKHVDSGGERVPPSTFAEPLPPSNLRQRVKEWVKQKHEERRVKINP